MSGAGYLIVPDALPPDLLARTLAAVDEVAAEERSHIKNPDPLKPELDILTSTFRTVSRHDAFLELLDTPKTFPLLWDMLGWNIQLYISHMIVYPPEPPDAPRRKGGAGWHIDGGRPVWEMEERPQPRLALKIGYFLTDTTVPDCGASEHTKSSPRTTLSSRLCSLTNQPTHSLLTH